MVQILLIGLGAGAATALLFASVASGSLVSILLFYLSPLPILIAGLGWSHWAALVGAVVSAASLSVAFGLLFFVAVLLSVGLPAWWLSYLALLARPAALPSPHDLEWYPVGRLVVWAAGLGALVVVSAIPHFGLDIDSFQAGLKRAFERIMRIETSAPAGSPVEVPGVSDPERLVRFLVLVVPPAAAVVSTLTQILNLWLAARIVNVSGRLKRPWPDLSQMTFPTFTPGLVGLSIAGSLLPGLAGVVCGIFSASLLIAYALLGFAVLHAITRGRASRGVVLAAAYSVVFVFGWPILAATLLGLADAAFDLRGRLANKAAPPR